MNLNQPLYERIQRGHDMAIKASPNHLGQQIYAVMSQTTPDTFYHVTLNPDRCTCPDFEYRVSQGVLGPSGTCKHIMAVKLSLPLPVGA